MTADFAGKPIIGDVTRGYEKPLKEQWGADKFLELAEAVFDADPKVQAFAWHQYTPYFNDGDPCVFNVYEPEFIWYSDNPMPPSMASAHKYGDDIDEDDEDETANLWVDEYNDGGVRMRVRTWNGETAEEHGTPLTAAWSELKDKFGHFQHLVSEKFGDHAEVVYTRDGTFYVEYYEHD